MTHKHAEGPRSAQHHNRTEELYTEGLPNCNRCVALKNIYDRQVVEQGVLRLKVMDLEAEILRLKTELDAEQFSHYVLMHPNVLVDIEH